MPSLLTVLTHPHDHLRARAQEVDKAYLQTPEFKQFIKDFTYTMRKKDGVGLAAIQVDVPRRIICIKNDIIPPEIRTALKLKRKKDLILVNPSWFALTAAKVWGAEGCLSVPGMWGEVERSFDVHANGILPDGSITEFDAHDFFARVIQHEVDHINGILFIDKARNVSKESK